MASVSKRRWAHKGAIKEAWIVRYNDPGGGRPAKQFGTKKEADAYRRKVEREIEDGTLVGPNASLSVEDVCTRYLANAEQRQARGEISELHVVKCRRFVRMHIVPAIGRVVFKDLRAEHVDMLHHALSKTMQPHVARPVLGFLATVETFANRHRYCLTNPVAAALKGIRGAPSLASASLRLKRRGQCCAPFWRIARTGRCGMRPCSLVSSTSPPAAGCV